MCCNDENDRNIAFILESIVRLQQRNNECGETPTCTKPFLGPSIDIACLNTRPLNLYTCCNNTLWTIPYTLNGEDGESSIFRIESIDDDCATFRVLAPNTDPTATYPYLATNDFFTIKICCIGIIKCLEDTLVSGI